MFWHAGCLSPPLSSSSSSSSSSFSRPPPQRPVCEQQWLFGSAQQWETQSKCNRSANSLWVKLFLRFQVCNCQWVYDNLHDATVASLGLVTPERNYQWVGEDPYTIISSSGGYVIIIYNINYIHVFYFSISEWKMNFLKIKKLVLVGGPDDGVITPWQSRWVHPPPCLVAQKYFVLTGY